MSILILWLLTFDGLLDVKVVMKVGDIVAKSARSRLRLRAFLIFALDEMLDEFTSIM